MNWVLILVLLILAGSIATGYHKGLLRMAYSLVSWIIVMAVVSWAAPHINQYIVENTSIYDRIMERCEEAVRQSANERTEAAVTEQESRLQSLGMNVPDVVFEGILEKSTNAADRFLEESGVYAQLAAGLADFILQGISFLAALVFAWLLTHIISQILGIVSRIPILKGINQTLGLFAGGIYGLIAVWIVFYIVALSGTSEVGRTLVSYIYENRFLIFLYENNLVLILILQFL